jgi:hypothetical protein
VPAVVTAFNGVKSGGNPVLLLHTKPGGIAAATPPSILTGTLINSNIGNPYGKMLSTSIPDTAATGLHLTNFHVVLNKMKTVPGKVKKTKKGKKKIPPKFYISAKCSDKTWNFKETTYYRAGGTTQTADATQRCKQKKKKKTKQKSDSSFWCSREAAFGPPLFFCVPVPVAPALGSRSTYGRCVKGSPVRNRRGPATVTGR